MTDKFDIKRAVAALITKHQDPVAPITINKAYGAINQLATTLAGVSDKNKVKIYSYALMSAWDEPGQVDEVCHKPEFLMALCCQLAQAIVEYTNKLTKEYGE